MSRTTYLLFFSVCFFALICSCDKTQEKEVPVESVSISQPIAELLVGESIQLIAMISPKQATDQTVIWASSKPSVAIVSDGGIVTALAEGESTIIANAGGKSASCAVTVTSSSSSNVSVTGVTLDKSSLTLLVGEEATLKATVKPDNAPNKEVTWVSDKTSVATVDGNGKVTAKAVGEANITALTKIGGKKAVCNVTVTAESVKVTGISLNKSSLTIEVGETQSIVATITPSNATNKKVNWTSNDSSVAAVDENGNVTGKGLGSATIIATTADGGKKATCPVKVTSSSSNVAVTGVSLDKTSLTLSVGGSATLTATVKPDNASNKQVSWSSSATGIATVDGNGTVTAKATGSANITVTTKDGGKKATCQVTVTASSSGGGSSALDWQLNPDCILGTQNKLNATKPSSNYNASPYNQYGAILSTEEESYLARHFVNFVNYFDRSDYSRTINTRSTYIFKLMNYDSDMVAFKYDFSYISKDRFCAISGSDLKSICEGSKIPPSICLVNGYGKYDRIEVLVEVTEERGDSGSSSVRGYYYVVFDKYSHYCQSVSSYSPTLIAKELGTFQDGNDYILFHEMHPIINDKYGAKILVWDSDSYKWKLTNEGLAAGYSDVSRFSFSINKLIFNQLSKDTDGSFGAQLCAFQRGDCLYPWPVSGHVDDAGLDWRAQYAITKEKIAEYEYEVIYYSSVNQVTVVKDTGVIKILPTGKKTHPYHHPDGSVWK